MSWTKYAISKIEADYMRSADTHLIQLPQRHFKDIDIYFIRLNVKICIFYCIRLCLVFVFMALFLFEI